MPGRLFLNGKFYGGRVNGVCRVADRLVQELDRAACNGDRPASWDMRLLLPDGDTWAPEFGCIEPEMQRIGHTQLWEQAVLPFAARTGTLANFANLAPAWHNAQVTMVHDAQFRLFPDSYGMKLRLGYRLLIPRGARNSCRVLTVSDYARDSLAAFGVADPEQTLVVHNGADHILETAADDSVIARHGLNDRIYCVAFGAVAGYKNLSIVFDAFRRMQRSDIALVLVGPSRETLIAAGLTPPDDAIFVGHVEDKGLRALYEHALCLLFPSRTEGFGLPPLEAMTCGCPVIAAPAGAVPEMCRDTILYAGLDDPDEWALRIKTLADQPALRSAKVDAGRERAAHFTWHAAGQKLIRALAPIVEG